MALWTTCFLLLTAGDAAAPAPAAGPAAPAAPGQAPAPAPATPEEGQAPPPKVPRRSVEAPLAAMKPLPPAQDLLLQAKRDRASGKLVAMRDGAPSPLTVDPALQEALTAILRQYQTPYAAAVAIEPSTGRVLALAEHAEADPGLRGLATAAVFPAASIFKVVTAAALLEEGVTPEETVCFHGGKRGLHPRLLEDSERDHRCSTLSGALATSANVAFAKLTRRFLSAPKLQATARAFRFNAPIAFPVPAPVSLAAIPGDELGLPSAGAGFGDVYLSPLHGALIAAVPANRGLWRDPVLFEDDLPAAPPGERVLSEEHARALADMMEETVTSGTARRVFRERGFRVPGAVGKTGCLADRNPFRDYSWFVGYAPKDEPKVAVGAVIVNDYQWRIRATWLGREAMRLALEGQARWARAPAAAPGAAAEAQASLGGPTDAGVALEGPVGAGGPAGGP